MNAIYRDHWPTTLRDDFKTRDSTFFKTVDWSPIEERDARAGHRKTFVVRVQQVIIIIVVNVESTVSS